MKPYKPNYRDKKTGKMKKVSRWWFPCKDHLGRMRYFPGFTDLAATRQLADKTEKLIVCRINNEPLSRELSAWLQTIPAKLRDRFIAIGLLSKSKALSVSGKLLKEHLDDFESWLKTTKSRKYGCNRNEEYVQTTCSRIRRVFNDCGFVQWTDIDKEAVERYLGGLDVSSKTFNYYQQAAKQFCEWMVETSRASDSPLAKLKPIATDDTEHRRALSDDEVIKLLAAAENEPTRFAMTGHERAVLYLLTIETGLRGRELRSLSVSSFDLDNAVVVAEAEFCKNRRRAEQLIKHKRAEQLRGFFAGKDPDARAFHVPDKYRTAEMLRADLEPAGIPYLDDAGRKADFHSLRHTLATNLDRTSASIAERAAIMRHSDKGNLTLSVYTHVRPFDLRRAIEALPDFPWPGDQSEQSEALAATGTDDAKLVLDSATPQPKNLLPNLPELGGKQCTTVDGNGQTNRIRVNCEPNENVGANAKNAVFVGINDGKRDGVCATHAAAPLDKESGGADAGGVWPADV